MVKSPNIFRRGLDWFRSRLDPVDLDINMAANEKMKRRSIIPGAGIGRSPWEITGWAGTLPDDEKNERLRIIYTREAATHKIINEKAFDIFRAEYHLEGDKTVIEAIEQFRLDTMFDEKLLISVICAMWQGNGYLERLFSNDAGTIEDPPPPNSRILGYRVIDPTNCRPVVDTDMRSDTYDEVLFYKMPFRGTNRPALKAHTDRILHVVLNHDPMAEDHLGKSEIEAIYDAALNKRTVDVDMVQILHRKSCMLYHMRFKGAQEADLKAYQTQFGNMTNQTNLCSDENLEIREVGGSGAIASIEGLIRYYEDQICYGLGYPVSLFRGEGAGTISTSDTNMLAYHDRIKGYQYNLQKIIEKEFDIVLNGYDIRSVELQSTFDYTLNWGTLGGKDSQRDANIRLAESTAFLNMRNGGLDVKAALALIGWDQDLEDMGMAPEDMTYGDAGLYPPAIDIPDRSLSPLPSSSSVTSQVAQPASIQMSKSAARNMIMSVGPRGYARYINELHAGLKVAITELGRAISSKIVEGMAPQEVELMSINETNSTSPVDNLFIRAIQTTIQNAFTHGYKAAKGDLKEIRSGKRHMNLRMADVPRKPDDIDIPKEWFDIYPKEDIEFLKSYTFNFSVQRGREFEADLKTTIIEGLKQGKSIQQIRRDIQLKAAEMGTYEAERIARTEVLRAANEGRLRAYRADGVERVEYIVADDERLCDKCRPLDEKVVTIQEAQGTLPVHPQCRCSYLPLPPEWTGE